MKMQDDAADRDQHRGKTCHHAYRGLLGLWKDEGEPDEFNESLLRIRQELNYDSDDYLQEFDEAFKVAYPLPNLRQCLQHLGHDVNRDRITWGQQTGSRRVHKVRDTMQPKRGRYERDNESRYGSAAPSEYGDEDEGTFAVPKG